MGESYRAGDPVAAAASPESVKRSDDAGDAAKADLALAGDLFAMLFPGSDVHSVVSALMVERDTGVAPADSRGSELARVRALLHRGEGARELQHAFNNPLTALLAEAQLLEMDSASTPDVHAASQRILALARRLTALTRDLEADAANPRIG